jgi:hypothetical protein
LGDVGDHLLGVGEVAPVAGLDSQGGERDGEVGLAAAGLAEEQDRPAGVHESQRGEVFDETPVDGGLELEVELGDGLAEREPGVAEPGGEPAVAGGVGLFGDETAEELDVGPVVGPGLLGEGGEHLDGPVELEVTEVVLDLLVHAHAGSPSS